jgi:erythromycin esterase-like protein
MNSNIYDNAVKQLDEACNGDETKKKEAVKHARQAIKVAHEDRDAIEDLALHVKTVLQERTHKRKAREAVGILQHHASMMLDDIHELVRRVHQVDPNFAETARDEEQEEEEENSSSSSKKQKLCP